MTGSKSATTGLNVGAQILADTPPSRWRWFDDTLRMNDPKWFTGFAQLSPAVVAEAVEQADDPDHTIALLAMHPRDVVRAAAFDVAIHTATMTLLALSLVRATDRVTAIRAKAQTLVDARRVTGGDDQFIPYLRLLRAADEHGDEYLDRLRSSVVARVDESALITALAVADVTARREVARVLVERGDADQAFTAARAQDDSVTTVIVVRGLSPGFGALHADIGDAVRDLGSSDHRRVLDALPIVGAGLGEPQADAALFERMTEPGDLAAIGQTAEIVLGEGSDVGRRLFARAWNRVNVDEAWQIGDAQASALAAAWWDVAPESAVLADWTDLTADPDPAVAAGAADIEAWLRRNGYTT